MMHEPSDLQQFCDWLAAARNISFFTGAGVSTESGIADFRSPGGIWSQIKPIQFSDFVADEETRLEDWRRRFHFQAGFDAASPNRGHLAIASAVNARPGGHVITQNIDGLHQRSGIDESRIIEIHGNGTRAACLDCRSPMSLAEARQTIETEARAPRCRRCGGLVKAAVISFGEPMPADKMLQARQIAEQAEIFVVAGSSLVVQPAASLPVVAKEAGARLVIVNREPTPLDSLADLVLHSQIGETLGKAVAEMTP